MMIIPAIDLYDNTCVRLHKGKFDAVQSYSDDPLQQAMAFEKAGAKNLHIVDLNGAKSGSPVHLEIIKRIKQRTELTIQSGGGLRDKASIEESLQAGIDRVVIGSLAASQPELIQCLLDEYGVDRFVLALDVNMEKTPLIAIKGWLEKTSTSLWDLLAQYANYQNLAILCTDIGCDGMLTGPNIALYQEAVQRFPEFLWQASGGVSQLSDLEALQETGVSSVVVGKALYEKRFTLEEALRVEVC
jgi:phosphoribosylformimino-5-aminoimidazole carboxamide ribotide isomerase